jgi:hypothetical protein
MAGATFSLARLVRATWTHVAFAFVAMGAWTLYANRAHGAAALRPALVQGAISGAITLALKRALEAMSARLSPPLAYILALLLAVHLAIGTPEIAATIAVPWTVSSLYAVIYSAALARPGRG